MLVGRNFGPVAGRPWFMDQAQGGGQILERGSHHIDLQRALAGEVASVEALAGTVGLAQPEPGSVADAIVLVLHFASGAVGTIHSAWSRDGQPELYATDILATDATINLEFGPEAFRVGGVAGGQRSRASTATRWGGRSRASSTPCVPATAMRCSARRPMPGGRSRWRSRASGRWSRGGGSTCEARLRRCGRDRPAPVEVLAGHPDAIVAAVCDAQVDVAGAMAAATGATAYTDWEAMFEAEPLDGVFVCTPPAVHLGPARAAFERGVPVYLEKPLARSLDDGEAIVAAWRESGVLCAVGYQWRSVDLLDRLRAELGGASPGLLVSRSLGPTERGRAGQWFGDARESGGILFELGSHDIDLQRAIAGRVTAVQAASAAACWRQRRRGRPRSTTPSRSSCTSRAAAWASSRWGGPRPRIRRSTRST